MEQASKRILKQQTALNQRVHTTSPLSKSLFPYTREYTLTSSPTVTRLQFVHVSHSYTSPVHVSHRLCLPPDTRLPGSFKMSLTFTLNIYTSPVHVSHSYTSPVHVSHSSVHVYHCLPLIHVSRSWLHMLAAVVEYLYSSMLQRVHGAEKMTLQTCENEAKQLLKSFPNNLGQATAARLQSHKHEVVLPFTKAMLQFMRTVVHRSPVHLVARLSPVYAPHICAPSFEYGRESCRVHLLSFSMLKIDFFTWIRPSQVQLDEENFPLVTDAGAGLFATRELFPG